MPSLLPSTWSPECWTPAYVLNRIRSTFYWKTHPHLPWLTADANRILLKTIQPHFHVLEFGSGRSTRFFDQRCASVITLERDPRWIQKLNQARLRNTTLLQVPPDQYAAQTDRFADHTFDLILIDGPDRLNCLTCSLSKLKPGGTLILDNANRYFPNQSPGPGSLRAYTPGNPEHHLAQSLQQTLKDGPQTWTSNGVTDTLILYKPEK